MSSTEPNIQQVMSPSPQGDYGLNDDGQYLNHNGLRYSCRPQDLMENHTDHGESDEFKDDDQCLDHNGSRHSLRSQDHFLCHQDQEESDGEEEMEQLQESILQMQEELVMLRLKRAQMTQQKKLKSRASMENEGSKKKAAERELERTPSSIKMERVVDSTSGGRRNHEFAVSRMNPRPSEEEEKESCRNKRSNETRARSPSTDRRRAAEPKVNGQRMQTPRSGRSKKNGMGMKPPSNENSASFDSQATLLNSWSNGPAISLQDSAIKMRGMQTSKRFVPDLSGSVVYRGSLKGDAGGYQPQTMDMNDQGAT
ncbi:MAG: hypothetical protein GY836_17940, partial [Herbaspirillum sp.]|uniref:hypothetical protein n=1 Tax=Herbaspirillum sp. TaxID=1890675 RepID=UPI00258AF70C